MKNPYILNGILILLLLSGAGLSAYAQPSAAAQGIHRWHNIHPGINLPAATVAQYKNLPAADYTPANRLEEWSAEEKLASFAAGFSGRLAARYMFTVDEKGYVRKVKVLSTNNEKGAAAFVSIILNTKVSGPSYLRNKAVSAYVPCDIAIDNHKITIL
ncbi:MAG TPA: hypothetical protein PK339_10000 [Flavitalea sp.]|nr:hypothetical protein [Flavitalea sp.]